MKKMYMLLLVVLLMFITSCDTGYNISGIVSGTNINGVTITLSGNSAGATTTDASGNYNFSGLSNGIYTVTPSIAGSTFNPTSISVTVNNADVIGQNFTGTGGAGGGLPQTGQTACYDTSGNVIVCTNTGQDGALLKGIAWPNPRFTDNGDQTITDNLTGLMWTKDGNATGPVGCASGVTEAWQPALDYFVCLNNNNYLGHNDWRLPNVNELRSLVNYSQPNSATWLNMQGFTNVQAGSYWSSTTYAPSTGAAWIVGMDNGNVNSNDKSNTTHVWPVRSGQ